MAKIHKSTVKGYAGSLEELAIEIGDLKYDALKEFLAHLQTKFDEDSDADFNRGRERLAEALYNTARGIEHAGDQIAEAWKISEPFMKD
jgi:hypothetical protein